MSCDNVITVQELETDKKHSTYYREVITGKAGGTGADIDLATNAVTGQTQTTLPKVLSNVGFSPAVFDFTTGGTLTERNKAIFYQADGNWYSWGGTLPKIVPAASSPASTGGIADNAWNVSTSAFMYRDWEGFTAELLAQGGVPDNGQPDELGNSKRVDAMRKIFGNVGTVSDIAAGKFKVGAVVMVTDRANALFKVISGGTADGFGAIPAGMGNTAVIVDFDGDVRKIGASTDGSDCTSALQAAAGYVGAGGKLKFENGYRFKFGILNITERYVEITGGGELDGTIRIFSKNYISANDLDMFFKVSGLRFKTTNQSINAIEICYARRGIITECEFDGYNAAIKKIPTTVLPSPQTWGQNVNRIRVTDSTYSNVNYFVMSGVSPNIAFDAADWIVSENEGTAKIRHVSFDGIDGLTLNDNIMFFAGANTSDGAKEENVYINRGAWLNIHDNKFFEAGKSGLLLSSCSRFNVHDNLYAFCGQRIESAALAIINSPVGGDYFSQGIVHNENIQDPSGDGVYISAKQGRLKVSNNLIQRPSSPTYYYGAEQLLNNKYGINMDSNDTIDISVDSNHVRWGSVKFTGGIGSSNSATDNKVDKLGDGSTSHRETEMRTLTITSGGVIDVTNYDAVNANPATAATITGFVNNGPTKQITIKQFSSANLLTLTHSTTLHLAGNANATLSVRDTITLLVSNGGDTVEVCRAI